MRDAQAQTLRCAAAASRRLRWNRVPRSSAAAGATRAAAAMGKHITKPKSVSDWVARIKALGPAPAAPSEAAHSLLVHPSWIEQNLPRVQQVAVDGLVLSADMRHAKRSISAVAETPGGSKRSSVSLDFRKSASSPAACIRWQGGGTSGGGC